MPDKESPQLGLLPGRRILTVSGLNRAARLAVERALGTIWVEGEISNLAMPASGHMYWSLKDVDSQVRCAMFRQANRALSFVPDNGMQVLLQARAGIYEARGEFQLVVDYMEEAGLGLLRQRFEALKKKLAAEGLFDAARKKALPSLPLRIGIISSPTGAAIRDVLIALKRRFPATGVIVYPTSVQGSAAAAEIAAALKIADERAECELLILTRGGGSLEDLWPFNEEAVARALAGMSIPVIAGIGHETDFTIADFVADLRAPTPSQAAELAVPEWRELFGRLADFGKRISRSIVQRFAAERRALDSLSHRLSREHPGVALQAIEQRLDGLDTRMLRTLKQSLSNPGRRLAELRGRLLRFDAARRIDRARDRLRQSEIAAGRSMRQQLEQRSARLRLAERSLRALGPQSTLERGYAIVTRDADGAIVRHSADLSRGDAVSVQLAEGSIGATIDAVRKNAR
jgi:exodeoxyribonuclease VII large subunit